MSMRTYCLLAWGVVACAAILFIRGATGPSKGTTGDRRVVV
jgi:hypothetical protein